MAPLAQRFLRPLVALAMIGTAAAPSIARADFILFTPDNSTVEEKLYNSAALKGVSFYTGSVGKQSGGIPVDVSTVGPVNTGAGFATIKPVKGTTLTSVTFTPHDQTLFNDFSTNGQLEGHGNSAETFTLTVVDQHGASFSFTETISANSNGNFPHDFGVLGINGETIRSVTFSAPNGIKESKQTEFSLAPDITPPPPPQQPVPEPASLALLAVGAAALPFCRRYLRR